MIARYFSSDSVWIPCHLVVMMILVEVGAAPPLLASCVGFLLGSVVSCFFLYVSTLSAAPAQRIIGLRYLGYTLIGAFINAAFFRLFQDFGHPHYLLTQAFSSGALVALVWLSRVRVHMPLLQQEKSH